jgi:hypothetical protein
VSARGSFVAAIMGVLGLVSVAWVAETMAASLAGAREDYVIGKGSNRDFPFFDVVIRAGPHGEHPRASGSTTFGGVTYSLSSVSCFIASGHTATWAGRLAPNPNFKYAKATALDGAGNTRDRFTAVGRDAPTGCETPASGFGGLTCLRSRRACRGRAVVLTGHGRRSWMVRFWIGPGRRAAVAVGLHRDQIKALDRRGQLSARIAALRAHRTVGDAEVTLLARR